jgi:hypothetical protein
MKVKEIITEGAGKKLTRQRYEEILARRDTLYNKMTHKQVAALLGKTPKHEAFARERAAHEVLMKEFGQDDFFAFLKIDEKYGSDDVKEIPQRIFKEDRYLDQWAKKKAAENRAKMNAEKEAQKAALARQKAADKAMKPLKPKKPTEWELWELAQDAVGKSFPDGDPVDHLPRDIDMDALDKAVKKYANPYNKGKAKYGLYDWLGDMWEDSQKDAIYDAQQQLKRGQDVEEYGPFFRVHNGEVKPTQNPWK